MKKSLLLKNILHPQLKKNDQILVSYPHLAVKGAKYVDFGGFLLVSMVICGDFKPSASLKL